MIPTGDWQEGILLTGDAVLSRLREVIETVDLQQAQREVEPFVRDPEALAVWAREFFLQISQRIRFVP
jgi:hypothetical protein